MGVNQSGISGFVGQELNRASETSPNGLRKRQNKESQNDKTTDSVSPIVVTR